MNPHVECTGLNKKPAYAISMKGLLEKGFSTIWKSDIKEYIMKRNIGEFDKNKQFLKAGTQEVTIKKAFSRKLRALVFTRASVNWTKVCGIILYYFSLFQTV